MFQLFSSTPFNQPINSWDVSNVTNMNYMFSNTPFNQPLENWNVSNVETMIFMFSGCSNFNQPLNNWNLVSVTDLNGMFYEASNFNQPLNNWNVSSVTNFSRVFLGASAFNQPINSWNVSNGIWFEYMFQNATSFNQPLNDWNVSNAFFLSNMFYLATQFNQDLSSWSFNSISNFESFLSYSGLDIINYESSLENFSNQNLTNKTLGAHGLQYCDNSDRLILTGTKGWTIEGDNQLQPSINPPTSISINLVGEACVASNVELGQASVIENCQTNLSLTNDAPASFPIGETIVTWTATDIDGNVYTAQQSVYVDLTPSSICYVTSDTVSLGKNRIFVTSDDLLIQILRESSSNNYSVVGVLEPGENSFLDETSNNLSQTYKYIVQTIDSCGNGSLIIDSLNSGNLPFHQTILLQSNIAANNTINLNWTHYQGVAFNQYKIYRNVNNGEFELLDIVSSSFNVYNDLSANINLNTYEYFVAIAVDDCNDSSGIQLINNKILSEIRSNRLNTSTMGITKNNLSEIVIYPNPTNEVLNIAVDKVKYLNSQIYNCLGEELFSTNDSSIQVSNLPAAYYFIKIETTEGSIFKSFIKE
jgi:surface protein